MGSELSGFLDVGSLRYTEVFASPARENIACDFVGLLKEVTVVESFV
jgi:hypothetical protein